MSIIISPIITTVGLGVFTPLATGIEFTFTHVAVGTGTSVASAANTALENEIARFPIAGGGMVTGGQAVSINGLITNHANANPQNYDITELGFYGVNSHGDTILFSIHRQSTAIVSKVSGADISAPFVMGLAALPVNNMTVQIDTNASAMLALLGQHTASNHPHTQYKRTLDNSERLKVATAVDADEAIRKDTLDALRLRLIANGIDANLGVTNHLPNINVDAFLIPEGYFDSSTLGDKPFSYGLCKTWKEDNTVVYQFAQSSTTGDFATRLYRESLGYWTAWKYYANISGSSTQLFSAANGTTGYEVVNKSQLDTKAPIAGNSSQEFEVATATTGNSAVNKTQFDAKTGLATDTVAGIVEKATLAELVAATADRYPDAALLLTGFDDQGSSMDLPDFLGNYGIRWGQTTATVASEGTITVTFSKDFPTACLHATAIYVNAGSDYNDVNHVFPQLVSADKYGAVFYLQSIIPQPTMSRTISWFAVGR